MTTKEKVIDQVRRYCMFVVALFVCSLGISFSIKADLGISPISSLPYVISLCTPLTTGNVTILLHVVLIIIQIILLRKRFQIFQLLQLPMAFIFGYFIDFTTWLISPINVPNYFMQWVYMFIGIVLCAIGLYMEVPCNVIMLASEGFLTAMNKVFGFEVGKVKIWFDIAMVVSSLLVSIFVLGGTIWPYTIQGIREGTFVAMILVGSFMRVLFRYDKIMDKILKNPPKEEEKKPEKAADEK